MVIRIIQSIRETCGITGLNGPWGKAVLPLWCACAACLLFLGLSPSPLPLLHPFDKLLHGVGCALLLALPAMLCRNFRAVMLLGGLVVLAGIGLEGYQMLLPAREVSLLDILANTAGVLLGMGIGRLLRRLRA